MTDPNQPGAKKIVLPPGVHLPPDDETDARVDIDVDGEGVASADPAVAALTAERDTLKDQLLRLQAEFANFRRRQNALLDDRMRFGAAPVLSELLPILDNFDRAMQASQSASDVASLIQGFALIQSQLASLLSGAGVSEIPSAPGTPFDPNLHEAIDVVPATDDTPADTIATERLKGYRLHGERVLRAARVAVAKAAETNEQA